MASTNKTTHYELSQYVGSDKPTYLTDYNGDMLAIDTAIYNAQTKADTAYANAGTADGKADTAITTANSALTNAGTANTNIGTMANLTTTEKTNLVGAINEVNAKANQNETDIAKFNFTTFTNYEKDSADLSITGGTINNGTVTVAKNSDGSICKIYGKINIAKTAQTARIYIANSGITPDSDITVAPIGLEIGQNNSGYGNSTAIYLRTTGTIEIVSYGTSAGNNADLVMIPFVIFVKDFGDVA